MIFGLIASIFIIMFLIQYSSQYSSFEEQSQSITILKNFNKVAGDVYLTGNSIDFDDFSHFGLDECYVRFNEPDTPVIKCGDIDYPTFIPMIFRSGEHVLMDGSYIDMGWWTTRFIMVYPDLKIIYNPVSGSAEDTARLLQEITSIFNCEWGVEGYACNDINRGTPFPTALQLEPRVKFGFCDDNTLDMTLCDGRACERYDMFTGSSDYILYGDPSGMGQCTAPLPSEYYNLVMIHDYCPSNLERGVCIETSDNGVGLMRIAGSDKAYVYKDILDIMALVIGGDRENMLGSLGDSIYTFKNEIMSRRLALAAKVTAGKYSLMSEEAEEKCCTSQNYEYGICSPIDETSCECRPLLKEFSYILCKPAAELDSICELATQDYHDYSMMLQLRMKLDEAAEEYDNLIDRGCEIE